MICEKCGGELIYVGEDVLLNKYLVFECNTCKFVMGKEKT